MAKMRTVLVLGAGASAPYGFPSGVTLKDKICQKLGDQSDMLMRLHVEPTEFAQVCKALIRAGRMSVDAFLAAQPQRAVQNGKLAIALALLPCEKTSTLFERWPRMRLGQTKGDIIGTAGGHWYELLFNLLTDGRQFEDIDLTNLSVVTFNYDRSLEYYLLTVLQNAYGRPLAQAAEKLSEMQIVHVHGSLGRLPLPPDENPDVVPYGDLSPASVVLARDNIQVLHETQDDSPDFKKARSLIVQAQRIYFFGFGFNHTNLRRLGLADMDPHSGVGGTTRHLPYDTIQRTEEFRFFKNHHLPHRPETGSPRWQEKDIYDYLYEHVQF
jgi:hypothetical protein